MEDNEQFQSTTKPKPSVERIQVGVRVRPALTKEFTKEEVVYCDPPTNSIKVSDITHVVKSKYDKILDQRSGQLDVFDFVKNSIRDVANGFNCTVFAYGQTGSGKTHTMFGPKWEQSVANRLRADMGEKDFFSDTENHGLIPRSITELFAMLDMSKYTVYCSFIQIYNEKLYDLLQDPKTENPLVIREEKFSGIFVEGLTEYCVEKERDCFVLLKRGERNRITR